jgi:hypothetical protein
LFALTLFITATQAQAAFTLSYGNLTQTVPANGTDLMTVTCPAGTKVISGGWESNSTAGRYLMVWVSRQVANTWRIMTVNTHPSQSYAITGYAVCASGVSGLGSYAAPWTVNVPGHSANGYSGSCPNGGIPTGGGFDSNFPDPAQLIPTQTRPTFTNEWYSSEYNSTSQSKAFTLYVTCMTGVSGSVTPVYGNWAAPFRNGPSTSVSASCFSGSFAVGGGFVTSLTTSFPSSTVQFVRTFISRPSTNQLTWTARTHNANQFDWGNLQPVVQCLHLN